MNLIKYISFFLLIALQSCNVVEPNVDSNANRSKSQSVLNPAHSDLTDSYKEYPGYRSTIHFDIREFGAHKLDSALVDIVLKPRIQDTFRRSFVHPYYAHIENNYISIPIIDSSREATFRINSLGYKGHSTMQNLTSDDTMIIAAELWPMYPDSAQLVIQHQYEKWIKKEQEKMKDYSDLELLDNENQ